MRLHGRMIRRRGHEIILLKRYLRWTDRRAFYGGGGGSGVLNAERGWLIGDGCTGVGVVSVGRGDMRNEFLSLGTG